MFISFCHQYEVVTSRPEAIAVTVSIWDKLFKNMLFTVHCSPEQIFVHIFYKLSWSGVSFATETESNTLTDKCSDVLLVGGCESRPVTNPNKLERHRATLPSLLLCICLPVHCHTYHDYRELSVHTYYIDCLHVQITSGTCSLKDKWLVTVTPMILI